MAIQYRRGSIEDIPQLYKVGVASYGVYCSQLSAEDAEKLLVNINTRDTYLRLLEHCTLFVCEDDEAGIVGMAFLQPSGHPSDIYPADWSCVRYVGVLPEYQGRGIARTLVQQCIAEARTQGEQIIALHTAELMKAAQHLYHSLGFRVVRELPTRFGMRYWLYSLALSGQVDNEQLTMGN